MLRIREEWRQLFDLFVENVLISQRQKYIQKVFRSLLEV